MKTFSNFVSEAKLEEIHVRDARGEVRDAFGYFPNKPNNLRGKRKETDAELLAASPRPVHIDQKTHEHLVLAGFRHDLDRSRKDDRSDHYEHGTHGHRAFDADGNVNYDD